MSLAYSRFLFFMVFIAGGLALGVSYYLEYAVGLTPYWLCLAQRVCLALLTGSCLLASLQGPRRLGTSLYWLLIVFCCVAGMAMARRQIILQSDPVQHLSGCSSGLVETLENTPWLRTVEQMFKGTVDCVEMSWTLFDLSIPEWSLLFFVAMMIVGVYQLLRPVWIAYQGPLSGESSPRSQRGD